MALTGMVKAIEQMAVQDGPGLRLIVFLKGCMIRCKWCQNPETINPRPEVWFKKFLCKGEGRCAEVCPTGAITMEGDRKFIPEKCNQCLKCVAACPNEAWEVVGYEMSVEDLVSEIKEYKFLYAASDRGGVTISGGSPLYQADFVAEVFKYCQQAGINTAIESCLYAPYDRVWKVVSLCNILMCDVKHMDSDKHKEGTGVPNVLILENLRKINAEETPPGRVELEIAVRVPLIPGYNDDEENIRRTIEFLHPLSKVRRLDLLPFNAMPIAKYDALSVPWECADMRRQSDEYLENLKQIVESYDRFKVSIGGMW